MWKFLLSDSNGFGKNVIIIGPYMSSSVHADTEKKFLVKDQRMGKTILRWLQKKIFYTFYRATQEILFKFALWWGEKVFVNNVETYKFKAKDFEKRSFVLLGNDSKDFLAENKKSLDNTNIYIIFQSIMIVLMLLIFWIFINI